MSYILYNRVEDRVWDRVWDRVEMRVRVRVCDVAFEEMNG